MIDWVNFIDRQFPVLSREMWRSFYNFLAWRFPNPDVAFMNYGYADEHLTLELDPADESDRYCIQLYACLLQHISIQNLDLLEVGCGRGGGSAWLARTQNVQSITGLDLSDRAIHLCQKLHQHPTLSYVQGDAEKLPFPDQTFDVILNVESCHHYPSMPQFLREVQRVLRPDGYFWFIDYREQEDLDALKNALEQSDLQLIQFRDVTPAIVKALDLTEKRKIELIQNHIPPFLTPLIKTFAAVKGTDVYERFVQGQLVYVEGFFKKADLMANAVR